MSIDGIKELPQRTRALLSIGDFDLEGESYTLSIPGSLADVFAWLADEIPVTAYDYLRELIGDTLILYRPGPFPGTKEPFIGLYGFRRVIEDNRSAFTIIYSPEGERSAALLMARLGSALGAPWQGFWKQKLLPESAAHAAEPSKPVQKKVKRSAWLKTEYGLEKLREIRIEAIENHRLIPTKTAAMNQADIDPKTFKNHDKELYARWDDETYR